MPPNLELLHFIDVLRHIVPQIVIFNPAEVTPIFLRPEGAVNQKKLPRKQIKEYLRHTRALIRPWVGLNLFLWNYSSYVSVCVLEREHNHYMNIGTAC